MAVLEGALRGSKLDRIQAKVTRIAAVAERHQRNIDLVKLSREFLGIEGVYAQIHTREWSPDLAGRLLSAGCLKVEATFAEGFRVTSGDLLISLGAVILEARDSGALLRAVDLLVNDFPESLAGMEIDERGHRVTLYWN